jgi:hypothetical protein
MIVEFPELYRKPLRRRRSVYPASDKSLDVAYLSNVLLARVLVLLLK